ncbi:MAG: hypothetical protein HGA80_01955 [Candidatus Omnitrophica bacterium]|nr:hypothetical protein [Candidatus Omnitrophota bacterium]
MQKISFLRSWLAWLLAGLIICIVGIEVRLYPLTHNVASDAYEQATLLVINRIRTTVAASINAQYPDMPPAQKSALMTVKVNEIMRKDNARLRKAFDEVGQQLLQKSGEQKHYLQESDSYYFLNLTENILEKGDVSQQVKGSRYFNELMLAPLGFWEPQLWHPYVGAWVYRIVHFFAPGTDLMYGVAWTPIFLLPLVAAAFLLACRAMGCSPLPSFTAGIFFILAHIYLKRSTFAWYDNDTYTVLFPVMTLACFFLSLKAIDQVKRLVGFAILTGLTAALYSRFWPGWGYIWGLTSAATVALAGKAFLLKETRLPRLGLLLALLLVVPVLAITIMIGLPQFCETLVTAWGELQKFTAPRIKDWPDLFIVVGELKRGTLQDIMEFSGGAIPCIGALATLVWAGARSVRERKSPSDVTITLALFLGATLILSLGAQRFAILSVTPVALLFALGLEELWQSRQKLARKFGSAEDVRGIPEKLLRALLLVAVVIPVVTSHLSIRSLLNPIFNSAWDRALTSLRDNSPADSIVNTWWSPGHFVKAISQRRVTFDGASIRGEQGYWLTQFYLAQDERSALGILRMLNTSSNNAAEYLQSLDMPLSTAVPLLLEVTRVKKAEAERALLKVLPPKSVAGLLKLTHGDKPVPPPSYVLLYQEMLDGNVLLGYVGKWDFAKVEKLNRDPSALRKIPGKSSPDFIDFLWSLVGGPFKQSSVLSAVGGDATRIVFEDGIALNTTDMSVQINSPKFGRGIPQSIVYWDATQNAVLEKKLPGGNLGYSLVFFKDEGVPKAALMDRLLANSLIVKMYYFEGKGLKYFKPFAKERDLTGRTRIYIYEVAWPKDF